MSRAIPANQLSPLAATCVSTQCALLPAPALINIAARWTRSRAAHWCAAADRSPGERRVNHRSPIVVAPPCRRWTSSQFDHCARHCSARDDTTAPATRHSICFLFSPISFTRLEPERRAVIARPATDTDLRTSRTVHLNEPKRAALLI